jgi:hypothetical protein
MYIKYITYICSTIIRFHVYGSWNITKQKKIEKLMQCLFVKSPPLSYGKVKFSFFILNLRRSSFKVFLFKKYYYAFIVQKMQK